MVLLKFDLIFGIHQLESSVIPRESANRKFHNIVTFAANKQFYCGRSVIEAPLVKGWNKVIFVFVSFKPLTCFIYII